MTMFWAAPPPEAVVVEDLQAVASNKTAPRIPKIRSGRGCEERMSASYSRAPTWEQRCPVPQPGPKMVTVVGLEASAPRWPGVFRLDRWVFGSPREVCVLLPGYRLKTRTPPGTACRGHELGGRHRSQIRQNHQRPADDPPLCVTGP